MNLIKGLRYISETLDKISHPSGRPTLAHRESINQLDRIQKIFDLDMLEEIIDDIELSSNKKNKFSKRQKIEMIREIKNELL